nr:hypothetical protein Iba_chr01aCG4750 [Ipomoea batatas]
MEDARAGRRPPLGLAGAALILHCCCCRPHVVEGGENRGIRLPFVTLAQVYGAVGRVDSDKTEKKMTEYRVLKVGKMEPNQDCDIYDVKRQELQDSLKAKEIMGVLGNATRYLSREPTAPSLSGVTLRTPSSSIVGGVDCDKTEKKIPECRILKDRKLEPNLACDIYDVKRQELMDLLKAKEIMVKRFDKMGGVDSDKTEKKMTEYRVLKVGKLEPNQACDIYDVKRQELQDSLKAKEIMVKSFDVLILVGGVDCDKTEKKIPECHVLKDRKLEPNQALGGVDCDKTEKKIPECRVLKDRKLEPNHACDIYDVKRQELKDLLKAKEIMGVVGNATRYLSREPTAPSPSGVTLRTPSSSIVGRVDSDKTEKKMTEYRVLKVGKLEPSQACDIYDVKRQELQDSLKAKEIMVKRFD